MQHDFHGRGGGGGGVQIIWEIYAMHIISIFILWIRCRKIRYDIFHISLENMKELFNAYFPLHGSHANSRHFVLSVLFCNMAILDSFVMFMTLI